MLRWERVPILGNNPVFCYEARRLWSRRTLILLPLVMFGVIAVHTILSLARFAAVPPVVPRSGARAVLARVRGVLPVGTAVHEAVGGEPSHEPWQWMQCTPYVAVTGLSLCVIMVARYLLSALAAASLAGDRVDGRLQQVLASRISARDILLGKLMALAAPACLLPVGAAVTLGVLGVVEGMPASLAFLALVAIVAEICVTIMAGIWSGAHVRPPALAVGLALLLGGVVLPVALTWLPGMLTSLVLEPEYVPTARGLVAAPPGMAVHLLTAGWLIGLCGLLFAALWLGARRALARAAE